jgi:hypothetical protein
MAGFDRASRAINCTYKYNCSRSHNCICIANKKSFCLTVFTGGKCASWHKFLIPLTGAQE